MTEKIACTNTMYYLLEPGDATRYHMFYTEFPEKYSQCGALADGVLTMKNHAVMLGISMPSAVGWGVVPKWVLADIRKDPAGCDVLHHIQYLQSPGHGFSKVQRVTFVTCLWMLAWLVKYPVDYEGAYKLVTALREVNYAPGIQQNS